MALSNRKLTAADIERCGAGGGGADVCIVTLGFEMTEDGKFMDVMDKTFDEVYGMLYGPLKERKPLFLRNGEQLYSYSYQGGRNGVKCLGFTGPFIACCDDTTEGVKYETSAEHYVWWADGNIAIYRISLPADYSTYLGTMPLNTPYEM